MEPLSCGMTMKRHDELLRSLIIFHCRRVSHKRLGVAVQPFVLLAKGAKGKACSAVIMQAISAPNVFVFGELLALPSVQQVGTCVCVCMCPLREMKNFVVVCLIIF
jgi:hypothetical protein